MIDLYVLNNLPSLGEMGDKTDIERTKSCSECNILDENIHEFSYKFASWNGQDLIEVAGNYIFVSEKVKIELEKHANGTLDFFKIKNEKADYFKIGKKAYQKEIPTFYKLEIKKRLDGPEIWWEREGKCPKCDRDQWNITLDGIGSSIDDDDYVPRQVYKNTWNGEMIFNLQDPGQPIVTQDFLDIVNSVTDQKIELRKAEWV